MKPGNRAYRLSELTRLLGGEWRGPADIEVRQVAPLEGAGPDEIAYLGSEAYRQALTGTRAGALVVDHETAAALTGRCCIVVPNPHAYFIRVAWLLNPLPELAPGVHAAACVHPGATVAATAEVAAFVTVGDGACIGERVRIGPGCHVGDGVRIGDDSLLHANVSVYAGSIIGNRAVLHSGCVIGSDGFGGAMEHGRWVKMPHIGRVVMGDDVEVGANTTIDRGAMADTVIAEGVKLDNQIQIGHNVRIGAHTAIAGCVGIAGSARIGARCVIGGAAMISGHLHIADGVHISGGTAVTSSIDEPGRYTGVFPMAEHRAWVRTAIALRRMGKADKRKGRGGVTPPEQDET
jgi:UDP-3-O-[3-hydroxymyristoyl] glucosamine N-acyltransferase